MNQFIATTSRTLTILMLILAVFLPTSAEAQSSDVWDIQRCIDYALQTNPTLQDFKFRKQINEANLRQSIEGNMPNMNIGGGFSRNFGRNENPLTSEFQTLAFNNFNTNISSSLNIFQGLQGFNRIKRDQINLDASEYTLQDAQNDLMLNIADAYLTILLNEELLESSELQLANTREQRDRTKKLVDAGSLPLSDLAELNAQVSTEELNLTNARNNLEMAYLNLQLFLNVDPRQNFAIEQPQLEDPEVPLHPSNPDEIYEFAEQNQPGIRGAQLTIVSADKDILIAKGGILPLVRLTGFAGTGYASGIVDPETFEPVSSFTQLDQNFNYGFNMNFTIPIYNRGQVRGDLARAEISKLQAQNQLEIEKQNLRRDIEQAHLDAVSSFSQFKQAERQLQFLEITLQNTKRQFEVGISNAVDFLVAQNNLARARFDKIRFKYDYIFKSKVLDFYLGKPISL